MRKHNKILVLLPAYNEQTNIGAAIEALLNQTRIPDKIVVVANGCTDDTVNLAKAYPVTVLQLDKLRHGKAEALNIAWAKYSKHFDIVVCADADTMFSNNSIEAWDRVLQKDENSGVGGCTGSISIVGDGILNTFQYLGFQHFVDLSVRYKNAVVFYGAACAIRQSVLEEVSSRNGDKGPWSYDTQVEDYKLGQDINLLGNATLMVPESSIQTFALPTVRMLIAQNIRWVSGLWKIHLQTRKDSLNSVGMRYWWIPELCRATLKVAWFLATISIVVLDRSLIWFSIVAMIVMHIWWLYPYAITRSRDSRDKFIKYTFFPLEYYSWIMSYITLKSFSIALIEHMTGISKRRWRDKG